MAKFSRRMAAAAVLLGLLGLVAASSEVEGPKTAAVSSPSAVAAKAKIPRPSGPSSSSGGLKMHLTANPRTKDHRNGKSE